MNLTESTLRNPAGAVVGIALVALFGVFSLTKLPVQLFPDIENPQINIQTTWRAASPNEMEAEIVEPIEEVLQGLPGMKEMDGSANTGFAWINLTFAVGTDMQKSMVEVISRMNRLPPLPRDADQPVITLGGWDGAVPALTWFFLQVLPGNDTPVLEYTTLIEDVISPAIESVPGVARAEEQTLGADAEEVQVIFDPFRAAELGIQLPTLVRTLGDAENVSGGQVDVGRRQYTLRFAGKYDPATLPEQVLEWRDGRPIRLGDIATVRIAQVDRFALASQNGNPALGIRVDRESGANVLKTLTEVKLVVQKLNDGPLKERNLRLVQSFDSSLYINRAISFLTGNLTAGVALSLGLLWWFVRHNRATLIIATAIPVSLLSTFIVLFLTGRSLNVISIAGVAFGIGIVVDTTIVVMENIVRLRDKGLGLLDSAAQGAREVWGALLASTATTVAIFIPVLFIKDVEGQLFADLALTISIAAVLSLIVSVTIVPLATSRWFGEQRSDDPHAGLWNRITNTVMALTSTPHKRQALIAALIGVPVLTTWLLLPELDYLPPVKRDAVDSFFMLPPAANIDTVKSEVVDVLQARLKPYMDGIKEPALKNYYILIWPSGGTMGVRVKDEPRLKEMEKIINTEITAGLPDFVAFSSQGDLFAGYDGGREIPVHLQARDQKALAAVAGRTMAWLQEALPEASIRPELPQAQPELRVIPDDRSLMEKGWSRAELGAILRALGDGIYVAEYFDGVKRKDVILRASKWTNPDELAAVPLATPSGGVVPLGQLATVEQTVGPDQVRRVDRKRTLTLRVVPPENMSLERTMAKIREVEPRTRAALPPDGNILYGGSADRLKQAVNTMAQNFALALMILFLLMAALFRSLKDSLLVMLTIPLATVGGVIALRLMNLFSFQPLDLLTMIGFIILLGLVVNNAILLVDQTRTAEREGTNRHQAVEQSLRYRLRPIFMGTLTTVLGMAPLVLVPGEGSVIYRGLATAIVGGLSISTVFTVLLLPCFLRMGASQPVLVTEGSMVQAEAPPRLESAA
ncbi:MAG: efflux RND transporter permease subunit [Gammaproteobacteria bacterium]|nr:efflux RND transporter permease subunit [Gammaproteobacteria bacterium]